MKEEAYIQLSENYPIKVGEFDLQILRIKEIDELFSHLQMSECHIG